MAPDAAKRQVPTIKRSVIEWLLDSDSSIRWQVMRDLTDASAEEVAAERARVATEGVAAQLPPQESTDGAAQHGTVGGITMQS
jgi:hypothetical protein